MATFHPSYKVITMLHAYLLKGAAPPLACTLIKGTILGAVEVLDAKIPEVANQHPSKVGNNLSTHTIAGLLKATTCPDLVIAAAAYLKFSQGQETFTRGEIQSQMKSASPYYKRSFSGGNLTRAFDTLTKADRLRLVSDNKYSFSAKEISALESRLAES